MSNRKRIAYAVHSYGFGHTTRSLTILSRLRDCEVLVFCGAKVEASFVEAGYRTVKIPTFEFVYGGHSLELFQTLSSNLPTLVDLKLGGVHYELIRDRIMAFQPDLIISDSEPFGTKVARHLEIPSIIVDNFSSLVYNNLELPWPDTLSKKISAAAYKFLMGSSSRTLVCSLHYDSKFKARSSMMQISPVYQDDIVRAMPTTGTHILVYMSRTEGWDLAPFWLKLIRCGYPVKVYGADSNATGMTVGAPQMEFCKFNRASFIKDLAGARAVIATAGSQLIGECAYLGKPILVIPHPVLEQKINAIYVERKNLGFAVPNLGDINQELIDKLAAHRVERSTRNGLDQAERFIRDILEG